MTRRLACHRPLPPGAMGVQQWQFSCFARWRFGMEFSADLDRQNPQLSSKMWTHENFKPLRSVAYLPIPMYKYVYIYIYIYTCTQVTDVYSTSIPFFHHRSWMIVLETDNVVPTGCRMTELAEKFR